MSIIISKEGSKAQRISRSSFGLEDNLQRFIHDNPESIPIHEIKEGLRLLILVREFPTGSGPIDALGIDQDGNLYIIETKLYKNADKRRVLAQILDYGASLWKTYGDGLSFISEIERQMIDPPPIDLATRIQSFYQIDSDSTNFITTQMQENLVHGRFRFVVLMDYVEDRLRDLILFVSQNSSFDVFGVELELYRYEKLEILIPKLYGAEIKKSSTPRQTKIWNETTFFEDADARLTAPLLLRLRNLYNFSKEWSDRITWGSSISKGSFNPKADTIHPSKSIYTVYSDGTLEINLGWLRDYAQSIPIVDALRHELQIANIFPGVSYVGNKDLKLVAEQWLPHVDALIAILRTIVRQPRNYNAIDSGTQTTI